jgi:GNAT superfamily N-acetyltransferase
MSFFMTVGLGKNNYILSRLLHDVLFAMNLVIKPLESRYQQKVETLVLTIQNEEFKLGISAHDQPDLPDLDAFYKQRGGEFWICVNEQDDVLGCIGFEKLDNQYGALRKMFLAKEMRGNKEVQLAQKLYDTLIEFAKALSIQLMCLDTPLIAKAAHRFYERNGWVLTPINQLPSSYKIPNINPSLIQFYTLTLHT